MQVSRRTFVKGAGAVAAAVTAGSILAGGPLKQALNIEAAATGRDEKYVASVCQQCPAGCGLMVRVVDGRAVKIEGNPLHPVNKGVLCPKGQIGLQILYDPDRIKGPLRRVGERGEGKWQRISWDEAVSAVASRLKEIRDRGEPHTVAILSGRNRGQAGGLIDRFVAAYGSPNHVGHSSICADNTKYGHLLTQGFKDYAGYDWENTKYLLCFGGGFIEAWRPTTLLLRMFGHMRRGTPVRAKIVQVDTRLSVTAAKADEWIPIKTGTDGALALGIAYVIINEKLYNKEFVEKYTSGFEDWSHLVLQKYPPQTVSDITGVPVDTIVRVAREFAATKPAIAAGERGASMQTNGVYNRMAIHALNGLVGSIGAPGGVLLQAGPPFKAPPAVVQDDIAKTGVKQPRIDWAGTKRYPLGSTVYQNIGEFFTGEGPYKANAMFLYYTNGLFSVPDLKRMEKAFKEVPFIVHFSPYMSEGAEYSDLILPDDSYLERWHDDTIYPSLGYPVGAIRQPVVKPLYDTMSTGTVLIKIAQAIGGSVAQSFPWNDFLEYIKFRYQGVYEAKRGTIVANSFEEWWNEFTSKGVWANPPYQFNNYARDLGGTPSKKFEFVSGYLEHKFEDLHMTDKDIEALKITARGEELFMPHYEPPRFVGDEREYPFLLNTYKLMTHAEGRGSNVPWLQEIHGVHAGFKWDSWVEINPMSAQGLGIKDGDEVWVESVIGKIKTRAKLYEGAQYNVVNMPFEQGHKAYGRWAKDRGANPNWIMVNETDHLSGTAAFFSTRVKIYKA